MLDGYEDIEDRSNRYPDNDNGYEWEYGDRRRAYNDSYGYGSGYSSSVSTYKDIAVASSRGSSTTFQFRSADSFLNSLNTNKNKNDNLDLSSYKAGVRVYHKKFGEGIINSVETEGEDLKVDINFEKVGHKRLMAKFAGLEIID